MKKIFFTSLIVIIGALIAGQSAFADGTTTLAVSPLIATSTVGEAFDISVQINPKEDKVCVVKGTINFENLNCQDIQLSSGIIAQTAPTCEVPNFTLGIPKCTSNTQDLFSVSVKGNTVGQSTLSFTNVKVIGVGVDVPFVSEKSFYDIFAADGSIPSITSSTTDTVIDNNDDEDEDTQGEDGDIEDDSNNTISSSTEKEVDSKLSGLSASALASISYAFNFVKGNLFALLSSIIVLILLGGAYWFLVIRKKD